jgi:hypothetical protein
MENKDMHINPIGSTLYAEKGLTKREYFAGLAMQALLSNPEWMKVNNNIKFLMPKDIVSDVAVEMADELLKRLEK